MHCVHNHRFRHTVRVGLCERLCCSGTLDRLMLMACLSLMCSNGAVILMLIDHSCGFLYNTEPEQRFVSILASVPVGWRGETKAYQRICRQEHIMWIMLKPIYYSQRVNTITGVNEFRMFLIFNPCLLCTNALALVIVCRCITEGA